MKKYKRLWLYITELGKYVVCSKAGNLYIADSEAEALDYAIKRLHPDGILDGVVTAPPAKAGGFRQH